MKQKNREIKLIFGAILFVFAIFLIFPVAKLLLKSFVGEMGMTIQFYQEVLGGKDFLKALSNSFLVAGLAAVLTTCIGFVLAYSIHYTNIPSGIKKVIELAARLPMLLPTITYGFAIMYSFGKQGFLTRIFGRQLFEIYGINGLLLGYVIYTLPISFVLIYNSMEYVDKKFMIVSRIMGDSPFATFRMTVLRPLLELWELPLSSAFS